MTSSRSSLTTDAQSISTDQSDEESELAISIRESLDDEGLKEDTQWYNKKEVLACIIGILCMMLLVEARLIFTELWSETVKIDSSSISRTQPRVNANWKRIELNTGLNKYITKKQPEPEQANVPNEQEASVNWNAHFVEFVPQPTNMKQLSQNDLVEYIEGTLLSNLPEYYNFSNSPIYYKKTKPAARKFIRYLQILSYLDYELGRYHKDVKAHKANIPGWKRGEEEKLTAKYLKCLARENASRKIEFDRVATALCDTQDARNYGKMTLTELKQSGYKRDVFSQPDWIRPNDFKVFHQDGIQYEDVTQTGKSGNCWLMAALQSLACRNPALIKQMITDKQNGLYEVELHLEGRDQIITVDSFFKKSISSHSHRAHWPILIEKAFAKYYNSPSYDALRGGSSSEAFTALTSYPAHCMQNGDFREAIRDFQTMKAYWDSGHFLTVTDEISGDGTGHAWSIVGFESSEDNNYVHISNPHNYSSHKEAREEYSSKDFNGLPFQRMGFVEGTKSTLRVPFWQIPKCFCVLTAAVYDTKIKTHQFRSTNRGDPNNIIKMELLKITCDRPVLVSFAMYTGIRLDDSQAAESHGAYLFPFCKETEKQWVASCFSHITETLDPKMEYYYVPFCKDANHDKDASLNIRISPFSECELSISTMSADEDLANFLALFSWS